MCRLTRCYEAWCGWVCLGDGGRWLPVRLPGRPANSPEFSRPGRPPRGHLLRPDGAAQSPANIEVTAEDKARIAERDFQDLRGAATGRVR